MVVACVFVCLCVCMRLYKYIGQHAEHGRSNGGKFKMLERRSEGL